MRVPSGSKKLQHITFVRTEESMNAHIEHGHRTLVRASVRPRRCGGVARADDGEEGALGAGSVRSWQRRHFYTGKRDCLKGSNF